MKDEDKTKGRIIAELQQIRQRVTELEQAEIAWQSTETSLRQSEKNLQTMLNSIGDAVIATETNGKIIHMNPVAEKLTGWKMDEAEGKPLSEIFRIFNSQTRKKAENLVSQVIDSGKIVRLVNHTMLISKDGREYQIADSSSPIMDAEKNITGMVLVFRDVTEAYKIQEKLQKSEEKLKQNLYELNAIINALPGIVTVVDTDFNVLVANDEVYKKFGQGSLSEVIGKPCYATRKGLKQPCPQCALVEAFKTGKTISRISTPEEEEQMGIATKSYAIPLKDENSVIWRGVEVIMDITDIRNIEENLKKSEEKYEVLVNGMRDTVWVIDFDGKFIDMNSAAIEILGYSREELLSMGPADIDSNLGAGTIEDLIIEMPSDKFQVFETTHTTKDGRPIPVEIQSCMVKYHGKNAILSIGRDITERKQAEKERLKLKKFESVGVLAGGIAHDFNNLLTGLFGNIEMAKMFLPANDKSYKFLESAGQSMESATHLTNQLLTFSRGGDPIKETLSIAEVLTETAQFSLRGSNVKLQTNIALDLWTVEADKGQLSQVISNLVINAQQAMPGGGIITLTAENIKTSKSRYVQITVHDEGMGIAPQYLDEIFDPYFTTKQKGSGLGLAVTHAIIHKHNGTITVYSTIDQGTTFTILLPASKAGERTISGETSDAINSEPVSPVHILLVDDEETVRDVLGAMLKKMGHQVSHAGAGQEAIAKYRSAQKNNLPYDAVITDLTIPGEMGGEAVAKEILAINPRAKIIVSSGYANDSIMANYKTYGFQGRVVKPVRYAALKNVLEQVLKK
jgi:PAS domain S-box-containing protein